MRPSSTGVLVCAPTNIAGKPCMNMPSSPYELPYAYSYAAYAQCVSSAKGPGGAPCESFSTNPNSCGKFVCNKQYSDMQNASYGPGK